MHTICYLKLCTVFPWHISVCTCRPVQCYNCWLKPTEMLHHNTNSIRENTRIRLIVRATFRSNLLLGWRAQFKRINNIAQSRVGVFWSSYFYNFQGIGECNWSPQLFLHRIVSLTKLRCKKIVFVSHNICLNGVVKKPLFTQASRHNIHWSTIVLDVEVLSWGTREIIVLKGYCSWSLLLF